MKIGVLIFVLIVGFVAAGMLALRNDSKQPLPKNLPPPLKDAEEDAEK